MTYERRMQTQSADASGEDLSSLYALHRARLLRYFLVAFRDPFEAEDAVQQVFAKAHEAAPSFRDRGGGPEAWLFRIARNHVIDQGRRSGRLELLEPAQVERLREAQAGVPTPRASDWISRPDVSALFDSLPLLQRQVLLLRYLFGFRHAESAWTLGTSVGSVRQAHHAALRSLERSLDGREEPTVTRRTQSPLRRLAMPWRFAGASFSLLAPARD
jgi:RNA polymerase sigma-70 factor (ECF subfamily)